MSWSSAEVGDQSGRVVLVTGGNSGIGLEAARVLAAHGARVVLGCRDRSRADHALDDLLGSTPSAAVEVLPLDLADLSSVELAAEEFAARHERLDVLVNNGGVMATPYRRTADGFELQFGVNHLGHFALTGRLLDRLLAADAPRVVTVSSSLHRRGRIAFDDLQGRRRYRKWEAYGQSKLANLLFSAELQRRATAAGQSLLAVAAHPGYASTGLQTAGPQMAGSRVGAWFAGLANRVFAQDASGGALPTVYAATSTDVAPDDFVGPGGPGGMRGAPVRDVPRSPAARDAADAARLWDVSEELTGVRYQALSRS